MRTTKIHLGAIGSILLIILLCCPVLADTVPDDAVYIRVVDVGQGLCTITRMPGNHFMIYDAGGEKVNGHSYDMGKECFKAVKNMIPISSNPNAKQPVIDLLVLSHTDSDHIYAADEIAKNYRIKATVRAGSKKSGEWKKANKALRKQVYYNGMWDIRLNKFDLFPGTKFGYGEQEGEEVIITFVTGHSEPPEDWDIKNKSELHNAGSIVVRLAYAGKSVLFTGDSLGKHTGVGNPKCNKNKKCTEFPLLMAEKEMYVRRNEVPLKSDVLFAGHHGADNSDSCCFIEAVDPKYVIFPAGSAHGHPRKTTVNRFKAYGITKEKMFRTDRCDDQSSKEWDYGRKPGYRAKAGDGDDIEIIIYKSGYLKVRYVNEQAPCMQD